MDEGTVGNGRQYAMEVALNFIAKTYVFFKKVVLRAVDAMHLNLIILFSKIPQSCFDKKKDINQKG